MVDSFAASYDPHDWAVLTATYGVVLAQLHSAFGTWHFGGPEYFIAQHGALHVVVHAVGRDYYALIAYAPPTPLAQALGHLRTAVDALHAEMS